MGQSTLTIEPQKNYTFPVNVCLYGYITNPDQSTDGSFVLYPMGSGKIAKTLSPLQSFSFSDESLNSIYNSGTIALDIVFSTAPFQLSKSQAYITSDIGQANTYMKDSKIPNPIAQDSSNNTQINFAAQNVANLINDNLDSQFFYVSNTVAISNYTGSYFKCIATVGANSYMKIKKITYIPYANCTDYNFLLSNQNNIGVNQAIQIPASSSMDIEFMGWKTVFNNTGTSILSLNFFQQSTISLTYTHQTDTVINTNSTTAQWTFEALLASGGEASNTDATEGTILIEYDIIGSVAWTTEYYNAGTASTTTGTGTTGGGGGCWSGDSLFIDEHLNIKPFEQFRIGDRIMTINGMETIEKIEKSGLHEVLEISPNIWITPLQPYRVRGVETRISEKEYQRLPRRFVPTYDCTVPSIWLRTVNPDILIKDKKLD